VGSVSLQDNGTRACRLQKVHRSCAGLSRPIRQWELRDMNGPLLLANDNWKESQQTEISGTGIPPTDDSESAMLAALNGGNYTAIVRGKDGTVGIGLVEAYRLP
jgi:hypothetical protein